MAGTSNTHGEMGGNRKERNHLVDLDVDGRILLR